MIAKLRLDRPATRRGLASLALAPAAFCAWFGSEWLFLATGSSPLAALPPGAQVRVLLEAIASLLPLIVSIQIVATLLAAVRPRLRFLAVIPGAVILGVLALLLIDNFTYTVLEYGIVRAAPGERPLYAALLLVLIGAAAGKLHGVLRKSERWSPRATVALAAAALVAGGAGAAWLLAEGSAARARSTSGSAGETRPNILLLGWDGVDATALSSYGYANDTTPFMRALKGETLFFENAFSNVGATRGALVTLLTGRLPTSTKVFCPPNVLQGRETAWHLPGILKQHGYATLQVGMRHYADSEDANLLGAFDGANYRWRGVVASHAAADEDDLLQRRIAGRAAERVLHVFGVREMPDAFAHIEGAQENPFFEDSRRIATLVRYFREAPEPWFVHAHMLDTHPRPSIAATEARDAALREMDGRFRELIRALEELEKLETTIVLVTSDHSSASTATGRVPLFIRFPHATPRGTVAANVQLADVAPTLLDHLGIEQPAWMDGASLLKGAPADRPLFAINRVSKDLRTTGFLLSEVRNAGPPNHGAAAAALIAGSGWYELDLESGAFAAGEIEGHTRPDLRPLDDERARALLTAQLERAGFRIGGGGARD